jgi:signal transduction histidine kinase
MMGSSRSSSIFRPDSSSPHGSQDSSRLPILRLCRLYSFLAIAAALIILICVGLNARLWGEISFIQSELVQKGLGLSNSHALTRTSFVLNWVGLFLLAAAVFYGFKIARQAHMDARKNEQFLLDAKQRTMELAALYDTTQQVSGTQELTALLQTILEKATTLLAAAGAAIFLYDHEHNDFQIAVEMGVGMPIGTHLPLNEGISGRVVETRSPVIVNDYQNWPGRSRNLKELPIRATVCVPMIRGGELVGILGVHEVTGTDRIFTDAEARLLSLFADNAAGAVHHARLLDELRSSEERFRIASESASDLIYDWDLLADRARFFGARYESLRAENQKIAHTRQEFWDTLHPEDRERIQEAFRNHLEAGKPFSEEYRVSDGKGAYLNVADRAMSIRNKHGKPVRLIGSVSDITERKRTEQMKSDFVSFVTHQLRTPLSGVKWMLELAMDAKDNPEEMQSFVQDARISTERLIRLVNDLLDVSRLERGKLKITPEYIDLADLTKGVLSEMAPLFQEKQLTFSLQAPENLPKPYVDVQLLRQIVLNLLSNSMKYTPLKGNIKIQIKPESDLLRWEIKDTGIGIPKADLSKLFEKFYRAGNVLAVETEGTGLGLYLVRLIVERFGGNVWCESEEGVGSTFVFTLPLAVKEVSV